MLERWVRSAGAADAGGGYGPEELRCWNGRNAGAADAEITGEEATEELRCWNGR